MIEWSGVYRMFRRPLLYVAAGLCAVLFLSYHVGLLTGMTGDPLLKLAKNGSTEHIVLYGTIQSVKQTEGKEGEQSRQFVVSVQGIEGADKSKSCRTLVREYSKTKNQEQLFCPGDQVVISGKLSLPAQKRNPGCFDYRLYLRTRNIQTIVTAQQIQHVTMRDESPVIRCYHRLCRNLYLRKTGYTQDLAQTAGSETAAMMDAILFGDKSNLDESAMEAFQKNGTAHILAVSGLHIGIIYAFILKLWTLLGELTGGFLCGRRGGWFFGFNAMFFFCYLILASFAPSAVRAVWMVLMHAFAQMTGRRYDLSSAAFAVLIAVLLRNPFMLFDLGLQMSFLAVLSMNLILPFVRRFYTGLFLASAAVQIGLGPFMLYHFNYISLIAVFLNVPVIMLAGVIVPAGLCCGVADLILGENAGSFYVVLDWLCDLLVQINQLTAAEGVTTFTIANPPVWLVVLYYLMLLLLASEEGRLRLLRAGREAGRKYRQRAKAFAKATAAALILSLAFGLLTSDGFHKTAITFVDVGQGDCMCIRTFTGMGRCKSAYLIDGGGSQNFDLGRKTLREYLLKNGVSKVDGAFVTHLHTDHYLGICQLAKTGMVRRIYVYDGYKSREPEICRDTGLKHNQITYLSAGQKLLFHESGKDHLEVEVLWPQKKTEAEYQRLLEDETNENDMSLLLRVNYDGVRMLATGDMDEKGENAVIATCSGESNRLESDILKVGHHGSKTSSSDIFLHYVKPSIAVIQVGEHNMYGHPTAEAMERIHKAGAWIYRNDRQGAVGIEINDAAIQKIRTMIHSQVP